MFFLKLEVGNEKCHCAFKRMVLDLGMCYLRALIYYLHRGTEGFESWEEEKSKFDSFFSFKMIRSFVSSLKVFEMM